MSTEPTLYSSYDEAIAAGAKGTDRVKEECINCDGGRKFWFARVLNGVCFQCNGRGWFSVQVRTVTYRNRRHAKLLAKAQAEEAERVAKAEARKQWEAENADTMELVRTLAETGSTFAADIRDAQYVIPTDRQIEVLHKIADDRANQIKVDVPEGRQFVSGRVVSYKITQNTFAYYGGDIVKILVEDPRGFRVFGTAPSAILEEAYNHFLKWVDSEGLNTSAFGPEYYLEKFLRGCDVEFTATLEGKEAGFGFFKRPTKAAFV